MPFHKNLTEIHRSHFFEYADAAARTGASLLPADIGKIARQLDDDSFWILNDDSPLTWTKIDGGSGGGAGGINFIGADDRDAENSIGSWVTYADAAGSDPVDGTGGAATTTLARTTTGAELIRGIGTFKVVKDAADRQGEGISIDFTIDPGYTESPKMMTIRFRYQSSANFEFNSGTAADPSDVSVWIYDVTNAVLIQPVPFLLNGNGEFVGEFQPNSDSTSYRLILHIGTTNASAWDFFADDFEVGPSVVAHAVPVTDWTTFTPTGSWTTAATYAGSFRRVGDNLEAHVRVTLSGGTDAVTLSINLPSGHVIDTTKLDGTTDKAIGVAQLVAGSGAASYNAIANFASSTAVGARIPANDSSASAHRNLDVSGTGVPLAFGSGDQVNIFYSVPIVGWGSNAVTSVESSQRVVIARVSGDAASATSGNPIIFPTVAFDSHAGYDNVAGRYTAPISGFYRVHGHINSTDVTVTVSIYVNAVSIIAAGATDAAGEGTYSGTVKVNAGDIIDLRPGATLDATATSTIHFERISSPQQIFASELVAANYETTAGAAIGALAVIKFDTKDFDTHNSYNTSTGLYTCPVTGKYSIGAHVTIASTSFTTADFLALDVFKNGSSFKNLSMILGNGTAFTYRTHGTTTVSCDQGDTIAIHGQSPASTLFTTTGFNYISIYKISGID